MTGYSLFLLDGLDSMSLRLTYPCYSDAVRVKQKLEAIYGQDAIAIETGGREASGSRLEMALPELQYA